MKKGVFLAFLLVASFLFVGLPSVSSQIIHDTPIGKTIVVVSNETFVLAYKMEWNDPDHNNFFVVTVYWDIPTNVSHLNFTYLDFVCQFTDGTPVPGVYLSHYEANPGPGYIRYTLGHIQDSGLDKDSAFWFNVTMRAAGVVNGSYVPHAGGDQRITISKVRCRELAEASAAGRCTIHVTPRISSCDSTGAPKDTFNYTENVYAKGYGFISNATIRLYVVQNATWTDSQTIGTDVRGAYSTADVDPAGNMPAADLGILPVGEYDIVADANNDTLYNGTATDAVDDATSAPGVIVVGVHDVAIISVTPSATVVNQGWAVDITVLAKNEGTYSESFNVSAYYGNATGNYTIERQLVTNLAGGMEKSLNLTWDTTPVPEGNYTILAQASVVPGETDTADNIKVDGNVTVIVPLIHDVATIDVTAYPTKVYHAWLVYINVSVKNEGDFFESFNVTAYYGNATGNYTIGMQTVTDLAIGANTTLSFQWNVTGVSPGAYSIFANASVIPGETDIADNTKVDGAVIVMPPVVTQAQITLVDIRTVHLYVDATFQEGITLKVSFYYYAGDLQAESTLWSGFPAQVVLSMNITLLQGDFVEVVELVLFEDGKEMSVAARFVVSQGVLDARLAELKNLWTVPDVDRTAIFREMVAIDGQWPYAPS